MDFRLFSKFWIFGVKIGQKSQKSKKVVKSVRNKAKDNGFGKKSKFWILVSDFRLFLEEVEKRGRRPKWRPKASQAEQIGRRPKGEAEGRTGGRRPPSLPQELAENSARRADFLLVYVIVVLPFGYLLQCDCPLIE